MPDKKIDSLADLTQDDRNANRGTERGGAMIERSLRTCGVGRSILIDKNGKIIAGNKTAENAGMIGIEGVQVVESDGTRLIAVQRTDLDLDSETDTRARELALLDNRTGEVNLDWNYDELKAIAEDGGVDLSDLFSDNELEGLIAETNSADESAAAAAPPTDFPDVDENIETAYQCPKCSYEWSGKPK